MLIQASLVGRKLGMGLPLHREQQNSASLQERPGQLASNREASAPNGPSGSVPPPPPGKFRMGVLGETTSETLDLAF